MRRLSIIRLQFTIRRRMDTATERTPTPLRGLPPPCRLLGQYAKPTSKLMLTILEGVATWEREIMLERQREGLPRPSWQAVEPASDLH